MRSISSLCYCYNFYISIIHYAFVLRNHYCDNETGPSTTKGGMNTTSPKQGGKREEGWKEVVRK